jgi:hypothetical protein
MRKTVISLTWLAAVSILTPGCLVKDTTETIYLEPDGSVTWTVLERDVRSDEKAATARARENAEYISAVTAERHPIALAFSRLGPADVRTQVLRADRPYTVLTIARFARLDVVMERFAEAVGGAATSVLDRHDGVVTWTWTVGDDEGAPAREQNEGVQALGDSFEQCRFVLSAGSFVGAEGFELSDDKRVATLRIPDKSSGTSATTPLRFSLTWAEVEK